MTDAAERLQTNWLNPPSIFRGAPLWSWNGELDVDRLCRAIESMHSAGMGGFFMNARIGLKTPYLSDEWFKCVRACVEKARELNMKAYIYDEDRWPSGYAGGLVTREHPEFSRHYLLSKSATEDPGDSNRLGVFNVQLDSQDRLMSYSPVQENAGKEEKLVAFDVARAEPDPIKNNSAYLDTMNAAAVRRFIDVTHEQYSKRFGKDFGELIPAIFTDEPDFDSPPWRSSAPGLGGRTCWTPQLPAQFKTRRGYDLLDHLPELFFAPAKGGFSKVLHDYNRTITELFVENYTAQVGKWCQEHNIALTGHMLAEESLGGQTLCAGATMQHYEHMQWPGTDILTGIWLELVTVKQCSSVSDQLGKERTLTEMYACAGWDWPLEGHKYLGDWHFVCGINFRCPHVTHYTLAGGGKRDFPVSIFDHSPWWKYYRVVEDYFARLSFMLTRGQPVRDVLVIHPIESAWGLQGKGEDGQVSRATLNDSLQRIIFALTGAHFDWDFGDESLLAKYAKLVDDGLQVERMTYKLVIVPPAVTLRSSTCALLKEFASAGGKVLFAGRAPDFVDGQPSGKIEELCKNASSCGDEAGQVISAVEGLLPRRVSITEGGAELDCVWAMQRVIEGGGLLFMQSQDRENAHRVHVRIEGASPVVNWNLQTGEQTLIASSQGDGFVEFDLDLPQTGSALVSMSLAVEGASQAAPAPAVESACELPGPYEIQLTEPNTLPLDYCMWWAEGGRYSQLMPSLKADQQIRDKFGLDPRGQAQPYYLYNSGVVDLSPRGRHQTKWTFHITDLPTACKLAIEKPENFDVLVNDQPAGNSDGWWVDEDFKLIDISSLLKAGDNEIVLSFDYRADMELESLHLVGDFGVDRRTPSAAAPGNMTLVAPPKSLDVGSWIGQGLDCFGGGVKYRMTVAHPGPGKRLRVSLPKVSCSAAAIHVNGQTFILPWRPFSADVTDALAEGDNELLVEVIGGRRNILGPLHTPTTVAEGADEEWTGSGHFNPRNKDWTDNYILTDHGLMAPVMVEVLA